MMKAYRPVSLGVWVIVLVVALILAGLLEPAHAQTGRITLLLDQTPSHGGTITPGPGVHYFSPNTEVTLTAVPRPGYQFICWLGDVSDPTAEHTVTYLDTPKIIVAVFEQTEYDILLTKGGMAGDGLISRAADFGWPGYSGTVGGTPEVTIHKQAKADDVVPEPESPASSAPVPEPATAILLALGGLSALARRGKKRAL
jgi:hypothetical protein